MVVGFMPSRSIHIDSWEINNQVKQYNGNMVQQALHNKINISGWTNPR